MSGDLLGTAQELVDKSGKRASVQAAEQEVHDWPGLHQKPGVTAFDVDRLRAVASDLSRVHSDLSSTVAGSPDDLTRRANLYGKHGFGNVDMGFCPLTIKAIDQYHQQVLAAVSREYTNALSALDAVIQGMGLTVQNLDEAEDRSLSSVKGVERLADGGPTGSTTVPVSTPVTATAPPPPPPAPPRPTSTPTKPVGPDGSFG